MSIERQLAQCVDDCQLKLAECTSIDELYVIRSQFIGKKSIIAEYFARLGTLAHEERIETAKQVNKAKQRIEQICDEAKQRVLARAGRMVISPIERTLPVTSYRGCDHPVTTATNTLCDIARKMGFVRIDGDEIVSVYENFDALHINQFHPARDPKDTFYLSGDRLLRTHTSSVQNAVLRQSELPIRCISPGRVFRNDTPDATHTPCFHQIEGLVVDQTSSFTDMLTTLQAILQAYFGRHFTMRIRPSYFPFTSISAEMDIDFQGRWVEVLGCGVVHRAVFEAAGITDTSIQGFAFGIGIERLLMLKYGLDDIRHLLSGDLRFLEQFHEIS